MKPVGTDAFRTSGASYDSSSLGPELPPFGCVIMASGQGRRFGGNKLLADFDGKPMLTWVLDATEGIFQRRAAVTRSPEVAALCQRRQVPVVLHDLPYRSDTVRLGLEAVGLDLAGCLFCPGDQPLLSRETVWKMVQQAVQEPEPIWRLAWGGAAGTPVLFPQRTFSQLLQLPQGKGGSAIFEQNLVRTVSARRYCELLDVDTPDELRGLLDNWGRRKPI